MIGSTKKIVVGLRLDPFFQAEGSPGYSCAEEANQLLVAAVALAVKSGAQLHLVTVLEEGALDITAAAPWLPQYHWRDMRLDTIKEASQKLAVANFEKQLSALAAAFRGPCEITTRLVSAQYAALGIMAEAVSTQATMIVLGAGVKADKYFTRGYSTPLAVMSESPVPVLVIGRNCTRDFTHDRIRILIADDLREHTAHAMASALDWAASLKNAADVLQVHIEEMSEKDMRRLLGQTATEMRSTADHAKLADDLVKALDQAFYERLKQRVQGAEERLKQSGGTFRFELKRCENVREELERVADAFGADMIVFGRHQKVYRRPFLVGRVTYQAMLSQNRGVMLIP